MIDMFGRVVVGVGVVGLLWRWRLEGKLVYTTTPWSTVS